MKTYNLTITIKEEFNPYQLRALTDDIQLAFGYLGYPVIVHIALEEDNYPTRAIITPNPQF